MTNVTVENQVALKDEKEVNRQFYGPLEKFRPLRFGSAARQEGCINWSAIPICACEILNGPPRPGVIPRSRHNGRYARGLPHRKTRSNMQLAIGAGPAIPP